LPLAGVLGWPIAHSRSPAMHEAAYAALGLSDWRYQRLPVPPDLLAETVRALEGAGFVGANVTIPHKEAALALADEATPETRTIGAANTLTFLDGAIRAANTDAPGLLAALSAAAGDDNPARGARALVLGAGGSARAAVWALRQAGAAEVMVWNRTPARAHELGAALGARPVDGAQPADLLVNCTPVGLREPDATFKDLPIDADTVSSFCYVIDLVYRDGDTPLVRAARTRGVTTVSGLDVLVHQGALSLESWLGRRAPIGAMREGALRHPSTPD
jgi:shikimate dehydrogenase